MKKLTVSVGTKNEAKLRAVKGAMREYEMFNDADVHSKGVHSGVSDQPMSMKETVEGAKNRAKAAFADCDLSIGLESGLVEVPGSTNGFLDLCVCAIYNGADFHIGLSCGFELPRDVQKFVNEGLNMTEAANRVGLSKNPKLGEAEGLIGILTKGRIKREDYTKQAVMTALIQIENAELYAKA